MGMSIKNAEAERLTRGLADVTGESLTEAITVAVKERLGRLRAHEPGEIERRRDDLRVHEHGELLYDERGLPR